MNKLEYEAILLVARCSALSSRELSPDRYGFGQNRSKTLINAIYWGFRLSVRTRLWLLAMELEV